MYSDRKSVSNRDMYSNSNNTSNNRTGFDYNRVGGGMHNQDVRGGYYGYNHYQQGPPCSPHYHHQDYRSPSRTHSEPRNSYSQGYNRSYTNSGSGGYRQHNTPTKSTPSYGYNNKGNKKPQDQAKPLKFGSDRKPHEPYTKKGITSSTAVVPSQDTNGPASRSTLDSGNMENKLDVNQATNDHELSEKTLESNKIEINDSVSCTKSESTTTCEPVTSTIVEYTPKLVEESTTMEVPTERVSESIQEEPNAILDDRINVNVKDCISMNEAQPISINEKDSANFSKDKSVIDATVQNIPEIVIVPAEELPEQDVISLEISPEALTETKEAESQRTEEEVIHESSTCSEEEIIHEPPPCSEEKIIHIPSPCSEEEVIHEPFPCSEEKTIHTPSLCSEEEVILKPSPCSEEEVIHTLFISEASPEQTSESLEPCEKEEEHKPSPILESIPESPENIPEQIVQEECPEARLTYESENKPISTGNESMLPEIVESVISDVIEKMGDDLPLKENDENAQKTVQVPETPKKKGCLKKDNEKTNIKSVDEDLTEKLDSMYITPVRSSRKSRVLLDSTNIVESSSISFVEVKNKDAPSEVLLTPVRRSTRKKAPVSSSQEPSQETLRKAKVVPNPFLNA